ncbi:unnamed protein product [Peniophora sp. CBMAI 1063]|nr:unnamed protein product [Peniophora sp. CBMAI 1063]
MAVQLDKQLFNARLKHILDCWTRAGKNDDFSSFADADGLFLPIGDPSPEDEPMKKGVAFQTWLLGFEFPATLMLITKDKVYVLCSPTKAKHLDQLRKHDTCIPIELLIQAKAKEPPTDALPRFVDAYTSLQRVGTLAKEAPTGKVIEEWKKAYEASGKAVETVDISVGVSALMAVKDEDELKYVRSAANLTSCLLANYAATKLETIIDRELEISHESFASQMEARLGSGEGDSAKGPDMKVWSKGRNLKDVEFDLVEFCYTPIIQSRNTKAGYDLRTAAESSADLMAHKGVFLISLGLRYKGYSSNVGRTFIIDADKEQEDNYNLLLALQADLLGRMKEGAVIRDLYQHALSFIKQKKPELEKHFVKNIGFGMGLEFRDASYLLSSKNARQLKSNMVFNLSLGFTDLVDKKGDKYALQLNDTVKIGLEKAVCFTDVVKATSDVMLYFTDEDAEKKAPKKPSKSNPSPAKNKTAGGKVLRNKTRSAAQAEIVQSAAQKIAEHQKELHEKIQAEGLEKWTESGTRAGGNEGKTFKKFQSYKGEAALPKDTENLRIMVDRKALTVILPIHGFAVPFHINAIKNVSKNDEGDYTYLRVNFQTPGQLTGKKEDTPFEDPDATFVRSITYRTLDGHRFDSISKQITELKKEVNKREQQKKELADVIEQDKLLEVKGRRPLKLAEVFIRPPLDGKRLPGEVEIHQNGLRYQSPMGSQKVDILFSNVEHVFFQPCDHELLVILHIHLKAPIMMGKKKSQDVQFYREASEAQFDETGNRKRKYRYGDEDEIEVEQQERKRRAMLNKEFKSFAERVVEALNASTGENMDVEIPFRELAFEGVPFRTNVKLQPTTDCLVHLTDTPFLVVNLNEIEIASLERVQFGLKQFDMILVHKDYTKTPLHINSIPSNQLDDVKGWLDNCDIPLAESAINLNWATIMKSINDSPYEFFQTGGWSFLGGAGDDSADEDESEQESEFEASDVEESEDDDESEFSDGTGSDDSGSGSYDDEDSSGDDWDALEAKAQRDDKKNGEPGRRRDDSDDDRPKKKAPAKGKTNGKATNGKARR